LFNNNVLVVTIDKFDPNPMLVNINKLKPYKFIEDKTLQVVLVKPNDLLMDEPIQTRELEPLLVELENFQHVEFEPICNYLTHANIKGTYVLVHHYHNVPIEDNDVNNSCDQNDMFRKALIDAYLLKVFNPKDCVHSCPQKHFYLKQYNESSFFHYIFSFSLNFSS